MSKALAFITGIAVIVVTLWLLFAPDFGPQSGTSPVTGAEPAATGSGQGPQQPAPVNDTQASGVRGSDKVENVPRWPDPDATSALPARPDNPARKARPVTSLWQSGGNPVKTEVDGFPATRLSADPEALRSLHVGQQVALQVPELNRTLTARLSTTYNQLNDIQVFRGPVSGGHEDDNVIVTRGRQSTYVVISTREGVYSAAIDNRTGETVLTSESDIQDNLAGQDDAIPVPGIEQHPPGEPSH